MVEMVQITENRLRQTIRTLLREGAWGYDPLQSDGALDQRDIIYDKFLDSVADKIEHAMCEDLLYGAVGMMIEVLEMFSEINFPISYHGEDGQGMKYDRVMRKAFEKLRGYKDWHQEWEHPEKIVKGITKAEKDYETIKKKLIKQWGD